MIYRCAFCDKPEVYTKFFGCPSTTWRPNMYSTCEQHKELSLRWEDVYPTEHCKPITRHECKIKENTVNEPKTT